MQQLDRTGLTESQAKKQLAQQGYNEIQEEKSSFARNMLEKLWGPIPWILEAALLLEVAFGKVAEPIIIAVLLLFSALFGSVQKVRAQKALSFLRSRLQITARVCRNGKWQLLPARELVAGDLVRIKTGDVIPADCAIIEGALEIDQSVLTGESASVSKSKGETIYSAAIARRGEIEAVVTATGPRSYYGKTAELVKTARPASHLEQLLFAVVRYLMAIDAVLAVILIAAVLVQGVALIPLIPFFLVLITATVPITMPAAFTVANAVEARALAKEGVLVTELSAVQEAATMDVLCVDKTGTLTQNKQSVAAVVSLSEASEEQILAMAKTACDESDNQLLEQAIFEACKQRSIPSLERQKLIPFDTMKKYSESYVQKEGRILRVAFGFPPAIQKMAQYRPDLEEQIQKLASSGMRVLAVAAGSEKQLTVQGLIALADSPRQDAAPLIQALRNLGIRILMVTGDTLATAQTIGRAIGLGERFANIKASLQDPLRYDGFANCYPEDKLILVKSLQRLSRVGMTGDGINDAAALKQAEVGIAVSTATDVAKASSRVVLTMPGLQNIIAVVSGGRRVYRRMLTWTITKIARTVELAALLTFGFIATGFFVTPLLSIVLIIVMNDIVTMTIATDKAGVSKSPEQWNMKEIALFSTLLGLGWIALGFAILLALFKTFHLPMPQIQTIMFAYLIYSAQMTIYLTRVRERFWTFAPSGLVALATGGNVILASVFSYCGILMQSVPLTFLAAAFIAVLATAFLLDEIKVRLFRKASV
jgi:H+-transporting ATPase